MTSHSWGWLRLIFGKEDSNDKDEAFGDYGRDVGKRKHVGIEVAMVGCFRYHLSLTWNERPSPPNFMSPILLSDSTYSASRTTASQAYNPASHETPPHPIAESQHVRTECRSGCQMQTMHANYHVRPRGFRKPVSSRAMHEQVLNLWAERCVPKPERPQAVRFVKHEPRCRRYFSSRDNISRDHTLVRYSLCDRCVSCCLSEHAE